MTNFRQRVVEEPLLKPIELIHSLSNQSHDLTSAASFDITERVSLMAVLHGLNQAVFFLHQKLHMELHLKEQVVLRFPVAHHLFNRVADVQDVIVGYPVGVEESLLSGQDIGTEPCVEIPHQALIFSRPSLYQIDAVELFFVVRKGLDAPVGDQAQQDNRQNRDDGRQQQLPLDGKIAEESERARHGLLLNQS